MTTTAQSITGWDEQTYAEIDKGHKLTQASVTASIEGEVRGAGYQPVVEVLPLGQHWLARRASPHHRTSAFQ
jgi:hypothetical protein